MPRTVLDEQLSSLNQELILIGSLCAQAIAQVCDALKYQDKNKALTVFKGDFNIEKKAQDIETLCFSIILHQQPVASDLRNVSAVLKMITDVERIGDQTRNIAEIISELNIQNAYNLAEIGTMADHVIEMVRDSIDAFTRHDQDLAQSVIDHDSVVDKLFYSLKQKLVEHIRSGNVNADMDLDLLMIAKYLERIGDHACNVAKWVIFGITGERQGNPKL